MNIALATWGIVFLGTPHQGSRHSSVSTTISRISKLLVPQRKNLINLLEGQSTKLSFELNGHFRFLLSICNINILSVNETLSTPVVGIVVHRDSTTLGYGREQVYSMNVTHWDLSKFASEEDERYQIIARALRGWVETISYTVPGMKTLKSQLMAADMEVKHMASPLEIFHMARSTHLTVWASTWYACFGNC
jgi:hypothetical protein